MSSATSNTNLKDKRFEGLFFQTASGEFVPPTNTEPRFVMDTTGFIENDLRMIQDLYSTNRAVRNYIKEHPVLRSVLIDAPDHIQKIFGVTPLQLRFSYVEEEKGLVLVVLTTLEAEEAIEKEEKLRHDWYFHLPKHIQGLLHVREEPIG